MSNYMKASDVIVASLAKAFVTLGGKRYEMIQFTEFESKFNVKIGEVAILGKVMKGHKATGADGEWSAKAHFNQSIFREVMVEYKNTGVFPYFDIQVTNEDTSSKVGRQTVILKDCLFEGGILSKFEAGGEFLEEELSGTFDDFEMKNKFNLLEGMI